MKVKEVSHCCDVVTLCYVTLGEGVTSRSIHQAVTSTRKSLKRWHITPFYKKTMKQASVFSTSMREKSMYKQIHDIIWDDILNDALIIKHHCSLNVILQIICKGQHSSYNVDIWHVYIKVDPIRRIFDLLIRGTSREWDITCSVY